MSGLNLQTDRGSIERGLQDRLAVLRNQEAPTARENRLRTAATADRATRAVAEAQFQANTQAARDEDMERTQQHTRATKLIAKINKRTDELTNALPEPAGGGEVGKLSKHYNKAMKAMTDTRGFIKQYAESNPNTNPDWDSIPDRRKRELLHFHQSLSSNAQHHRAITKFNTAKKHAEAFATEAGVVNFRGKLSDENQHKLDGWLDHLDVPVAESIPTARAVLPPGSTKTDTGGRKTRKRKRKRKRKTRKHRKKKKTRKRKPKKRHRRTRRH